MLLSLAREVILAIVTHRRFHAIMENGMHFTSTFSIFIHPQEINSASIGKAGRSNLANGLRKKWGRVDVKMLLTTTVTFSHYFQERVTNGL